MKRHIRGISPQLAYFAWRLTARGVGAVLDEFPNESIVEGFDERLAHQSLVDIEHREAITRQYLDLVGGDPAERTEAPSWQAVQLWIASIRDRARQLAWHPDGTVVLRFRDLGEDYRLVPDATITSATKPVRLFVELDRSNKGLSRIKENLESYDKFVRRVYGSVFDDRREPWVVYVVRSQARRDSVAKLARDVLTCRWKVVIAGPAATQWLVASLLDDRRYDLERADAPPIGDDVRPAALELLKSTSDLLKHSAAAFVRLGLEQPERVERWRNDLRALYKLMQSEASTNEG